MIDICEREQTDLLLIAGDLFHRQPLKKELKEVDYYFSRLSRTKVVLIAGNHDFFKEGFLLSELSVEQQCISAV